MKKHDVIEYFGNLNNARKVLGYKSSATVYLWGEIVPEAAAARLHVLTRGKLKYSPKDYGKPRKKTERQRRHKKPATSHD